MWKLFNVSIFSFGGSVFRTFLADLHKMYLEVIKDGKR